jgi:hypothetical protein
MKELHFILQTKLESSSTRENTDIGRSSLEYLKSSQLITSFVPVGGESVLQGEEYTEVQDMNENELSIVILSKQNHVRWSAARTIDGS